MLSDIDYSAILSRSKYHTDSQFEESLAELVETLKEEEIIQIFDASKIMPKIGSESVEQQVLMDLALYGVDAEEDDKTGKKSPQEIVTPEGHFCGVMLESMYSSLLLSRLLGCTCVMDRRKAEFAFSRFGGSYPMHASGARVFDELYSVLLPELDLHNQYRLFCSDRVMSSCAHSNECIQNAKRNLRRFIDDVLFMRENEGIVGLKNLTKKVEQERGNDAKAIRRAVMKDISRAERRIKSTYASIKIWTKYIASLSVAAVSAMSSSPSEALIPGGGVAMAGLAHAVVSKLEQKEQWKLLFRQKMEEARSPKEGIVKESSY